MIELTSAERMVLAAIAGNKYQEYKTQPSIFKKLEKNLLIELISDEQGNVIVARITPKGKYMLNQ